MGQAFYRRAPLELEKLPLKRFRPEEKKWNGVLCRNEEGEGKRKRMSAVY